MSLWKNMYFSFAWSTMCRLVQYRQITIWAFWDIIESLKEHRYFLLLVLNGKRDGCKGRIWCKRDWFLCPTSACCFLNQNHSLNLPTSSKVRIFLFFFFFEKNHQRDTNKNFVFGQTACVRKRQKLKTKTWESRRLDWHRGGISET